MYWYALSLAAFLYTWQTGCSREWTCKKPLRSIAELTHLAWKSAPHTLEWLLYLSLFHHHLPLKPSSTECPNWTVMYCVHHLIDCAHELFEMKNSTISGRVWAHLAHQMIAKRVCVRLPHWCESVLDYSSCCEEWQMLIQPYQHTVTLYAIFVEFVEL